MGDESRKQEGRKKARRETFHCIPYAVWGVLNYVYALLKKKYHGSKRNKPPPFPSTLCLAVTFPLWGRMEVPDFVCLL